MKKVLSVLLAVVLCLAFSTMAFAAEETASVNTEDLDSIVNDIVDAAGEGDLESVAGAVQVNADKLYAAFGDILEGADTVAADEAADYVITAISDLTGANMESVRVIVMDTIEEYGLEEVEIVESSAVAGLVDEILARLEALGIDTTPILETLANSKVGSGIIGAYVGETVTEPTVDEPTEEPTEAPEVPEIPVTGQASSIAAFAVLAVAAAGAFVCTRKKAE